MLPVLIWVKITTGRFADFDRWMCLFNSTLYHTVNWAKVLSVNIPVQVWGRKSRWRSYGWSTRNVHWTDKPWPKFPTGSELAPPPRLRPGPQPPSCTLAYLRQTIVGERVARYYMTLTRNYFRDIKRHTLQYEGKRIKSVLHPKVFRSHDEDVYACMCSCCVQSPVFSNECVCVFVCPCGYIRLYAVYSILK